MIAALRIGRMTEEPPVHEAVDRAERIVESPQKWMFGSILSNGSSAGLAA